MAIYHLNIRHCSKNKGQSAKAKFDYISRNDKYSNKIEDLKFCKSGNMPDFAENNPDYFWKSADDFERANARVCTEIEFALPRELTLDQQKKVIDEFINKIINNEDRQLPYSYAIHNDKENNNPHCHLIFSVRQNDKINRSAEQFFKRANSKNAELGGAKKDREVIKKEFLQNVRTTWRVIANEHLEKNGINQKIDERTLEEQGINREPLRRIDRVEFQKIRSLENQEKAISKELNATNNELNLEKKSENLIREQRENELKAVAEEYKDLNFDLPILKREKIKLEEDITSEDRAIQGAIRSIERAEQEIKKAKKGFVGTGLFISDYNKQNIIQFTEEREREIRYLERTRSKKDCMIKRLSEVKNKIILIEFRISEIIKNFPTLPEFIQKQREKIQNEKQQVEQKSMNQLFFETNQKLKKQAQEKQNANKKSGGMKL